MSSPWLVAQEITAGQEAAPGCSSKSARLPHLNRQLRTHAHPERTALLRRSLTISNGDNGRALYLYGGSICKLQRCTITRCAADKGGAFYLTPLTGTGELAAELPNGFSTILQMPECTVHGNSAAEMGGAFFVGELGVKGALVQVSRNTLVYDNHVHVMDYNLQHNYAHSKLQMILQYYHDYIQFYLLIN